MSTVATSGLSPMMKDILAWSKKLEPWKRDALRRLVQHGALNDDAIDELALSCLSSHILSDDVVAPKMVPLAAEHLPTTSIVGHDVRISAITQIERANALASGQQMEFCAEGLTVIYGDNGSGKTGYARVLKHACRARRKDNSIRSNVFEPDPKKPASAKLKCQLGANSKTIHWEDNCSPQELSSVSCFDSDCATVHVNDSNSVDFTPFGLDLFSKLVEICKRVKSVIESQVAGIDSRQSPVVGNPQHKSHTAVGRMLSRLNANTSPEDLAEVCQFGDKDVGRITAIERLLAADPKEQSTRIAQKINRVSSLKKRLKSLDSMLGFEGVEELRRLAKDARTKRDAARLAATELVSSQPLPGVGGNPWRELWVAAKKYSEIAYPNKAFPVTEADARCLLCHQELDTDASKRLASFESFVTQETEAAACKAEQLVNERLQQIKDLRCDGFEDVIAELKTEDELLGVLVERDVRNARALKAAIAESELPSLDSLSPGQFTSIQNLDEYTQSLEMQRTELLKAVDDEGRATLVAELDELKDKRWLNENLEAYVDEVGRLAELERLAKAKKETTSTAISRKGGELTKQYVTEELTKSFATEVKRLCRRAVRVELAKGKSTGGVATYRISLQSKQDAKPGEVLSEGEQRSIALAGFLAELSTCENKSALMFDDPVSSLDHHWRERFAVRLVREAKQRQVIVFTHDLVFLNDLIDRCRKTRQKYRAIEVTRGHDGIGTVEADLPFKAQATKDRIRGLRKLARNAKKAFEKNNDVRFERIATRIYSRLRSTIERAIEQDVFAGCVVRYRDWIKLRLLRKVAVLKTSDCEELIALYQRCHEIIDAHDKSTGRNALAPAPDEILEDLKILAKLIADIRARQRAA